MDMDMTSREFLTNFAMALRDNAHRQITGRCFDGDGGACAMGIALELNGVFSSSQMIQLGIATIFGVDHPEYTALNTRLGIAMIGDTVAGANNRGMNFTQIAEAVDKYLANTAPVQEVERELVGVA